MRLRLAHIPDLVCQVRCRMTNSGCWHRLLGRWMSRSAINPVWLGSRRYTAGIFWGRIEVSHTSRHFIKHTHMASGINIYSLMITDITNSNYWYKQLDLLQLRINVNSVCHTHTRTRMHCSTYCNAVFRSTIFFVLFWRSSREVVWNIPTFWVFWAAIFWGGRQAPEFRTQCYKF